MSYTVEQFRKTQLADSAYKTALSYTKGTVTSTYGTDVKVSATLTNSSSYYLKFSVAGNKSYSQKFTVKLTSSSDLTQTIDTYTVPATSGSKTYEMIFTPNSSYNAIVLELSRTSEDSKVMSVTIEDFYIVNNIISNFGTVEIKKIGIQGKPGQIICLNGEQIRIGRSGFYEIDNGYSITSIGFVIRESTDYFIVDYQY